MEELLVLIVYYYGPLLGRLPRPTLYAEYFLTVTHLRHTGTSDQSRKIPQNLSLRIRFDLLGRSDSNHVEKYKTVHIYLLSSIVTKPAVFPLALSYHIHAAYSLGIV